MEKNQILHIAYQAILEVSPYANTLLKGRDESSSQDISFIDYGINSIDYAEIAHIVMSKLNMDQPLDIFTCTDNLKGFVEIIHGLTIRRA